MRRFLASLLSRPRALIWYAAILALPLGAVYTGAELLMRAGFAAPSLTVGELFIVLAIWALFLAVSLGWVAVYGVLHPMERLIRRLNNGEAIPSDMLDEVGAVGQLAKIIASEMHTTQKKLEDAARCRRHAEGLDALWHKLAETIPCGILWISDNGMILKANPESVRMFDTNLVSMLDRDFCSLFDLSGQALVAAKLSRIRNGVAHDSHCTASIKSDSGKVLTLDITMARPSREGEVVATLRRADGVRMMDQAEVAASTASLANEQRLKLAFQAIGAGLWELSPEKNSFWCSPEFGALLGLDPEHLPTTLEARNALIHPEDLDWVLTCMQRYLAQEVEDYAPDYRMRHRDGTYIWIEDRGQALWGADGKAVKVSGTVKDCTERKRFETQLSYMATHDPLTDLPNRTLLNDRLAQAISLAKRSGLLVGVLLVDVDRFKLINESLGYEIGDQMIRDIAARLRQTLRPTDTLARISGDEFIILCEGLTSPQEAARTARRLLNAMSQTYLVDGNQLGITISIGISIGLTDGDEAHILLRHAETAMQKAKAAGGGAYRFFVQDMDREVVKRLNLERTIQDGIERQQFVLHYQPKVSMVTREVIGAEALIRWPHRKLGMISPMDFLPVAEESNQILAIGEWALREVLAQLSAWRDKGLAVVPVAVNLSGKQLVAGGIDELILRLLREFDVPASLLEVEITESSFISQMDKVQPVLQRLRQAGVGIALDDFGTGYSSLAYLRQMPISTLKIDRSFVKDIPEKASAMSLTALIIDIGHQLGMDVVAEGIETEAQMEFLQKEGCTFGQGWLFNPALSPSRFQKLLQKKTSDASKSAQEAS